MPEITVTGHQTMRSVTGEPDIEIDEDGELQIFPTGTEGGSLVLFMSIDDWRALNGAVEAVIAEHMAAKSNVIKIDRGSK